MIGLDRNILVRYSLKTRDSVAKATEIIERRITRKIPGFVSIVGDGRNRLGA